MSEWFDSAIVQAGRLPLFCMLVAFIATFLFIRFSVRMIRAEVSWWPGNVTPGGVHVHHVFFGVVVVVVAGFCLVALASYHTPVANCVLAALFGIGSALVLDEFALILHLRDVYWSEEGRSSIDAVFVAIAVILLFLMGLRPVGFAGEWGEYETAQDDVTRASVIGWLAVELVLVVITLLKGKLWTGLVGLFIPPLLVIGAIRIGRPRSPWARWRYRTRPAKREKSVRREVRYREPIVRWKIVVQEAVAGRFGIPDTPPAIPVTPAVPARAGRVPNRIASAIRWRRTRRRLEAVPSWRLPVLIVVIAVVLAVVLLYIDETYVLQGMDAGSTATLLAVIAGAMATLTGLVFTAITVAMQFGASQISVRVIPMLQQQPVMRWAIGVFLATFVFTLITALDIATGDRNEPAPGVSTTIAVLLAVLSAFLLIALVARVGTVLNSSGLLRWIAQEGYGAIHRLYPERSPIAGEIVGLPAGAATAPAEGAGEGGGAEREAVVELRDVPAEGRVLLGIDLRRIQRLAVRWNVRIDLLIGVGDFVPHHAPVFRVRGADHDVRPRQLLDTLLFGDTHRPSVSPAAALQAISDIALKALSPAVNDPARAVQALDHTEDLLLMLAPRVRAEQQSTSLHLISGYRRSWADYVAIATDEIRRYGSHAAQVQRRLRALLRTLIDQCPPDQHDPLLRRLRALDEQLARDWPSALDRWLAAAADRQGYGSEKGFAAPRRPLSINTDNTGGLGTAD